MDFRMAFCEVDELVIGNTERSLTHLVNAQSLQLRQLAQCDLLSRLIISIEDNHIFHLTGEFPDQFPESFTRTEVRHCDISERHRPRFRWPV